MIYLDHGATSFPKPPEVRMAMEQAVRTCGNPGRGGYPAAMEAARQVYACRESAARFFDCLPEQVAFTGSCTHGLNIAIRSLLKPGDRVVISGFEHNAVTRTLHDLGARIIIAGRKLFDWQDTLEAFEKALQSGVDAAVFTHVSNVFGYILPVHQMAALCRQYHTPFAIDAAQSAGSIPISLQELEADYIAMPGHKGLLGPCGTGILLCGKLPQPWMTGGTGSESEEQKMPDFLPDRVEAGTLNVPGIAGINAGIGYLKRHGQSRFFQKECAAVKYCAEELAQIGISTFAGTHQSGVLSFVPEIDCETFANELAKRGVAVRAGLHCAPLAHESAGTLETGTVRISFGPDASVKICNEFLQRVNDIWKRIK